MRFCLFEKAGKKLSRILYQVEDYLLLFLCKHQQSSKRREPDLLSNLVQFQLCTEFIKGYSSVNPLYPLSFVAARLHTGTLNQTDALKGYPIGLCVSSYIDITNCLGMILDYSFFSGPLIFTLTFAVQYGFYISSLILKDLSVKFFFFTVVRCLQQTLMRFNFNVHVSK